MIGNILDLVLTNAPHLIHEVTAEGRLGKSDHEMLCIKLAGTQPTEADPVQKPDWNKADWDGMRTELGDINWYTVLGSMNTEEAWLEIKTPCKESS